ncbi:MAG: lysozyme inhibitor LprI family protein [Lachnospiraceae bacterium]|nr:lysozyme inhibitor LprI family protein [Lachnospiraceae bacterium]
MKKKIIVFILAGCISFSLIGCKDKNSTTEPNTSEQTEKTESSATQNQEESEKPQDNSDINKTPVSEEIATVESAYQEILSRDTSNYTQGDMNAECYEEYELWNNELNALWDQIKSSLDEGAYTKLLDEQRAWLERKTFHIRACGSEAFGGSMQQMLESSGAADMTRVRCYQLAKILADARGEQFSMGDVEALIDYVDPSYDDVMWGFRGPYDMVSYDDSTGELMISHEFDEWEPIITYNGERQQVELWGYTSDRIIWKSTKDEFFEIGLSWEGELEFSHRDDLKDYVDVFN